MSKLNIYRASAGSGKTYTLTGEYLKLLFKDPLNYRSILAVTFTNKATDEMKSRILKEIDDLAKGRDSGYASELMEINKVSASELQKTAKLILGKLLHDYSRFSVTTIDSFFQKVVRSFTREIGLQMGFKVELDQRGVMDQVIDNLFLDVDNDDNLRKWLIRFAESKIKEGKSWNFKKDILELGDEVFKEDFKTFDKALIHKLSDKKFLASYRSVLQEVKDDFEKYFLNIGEQVREIISQQGLSVDDFAYGKSGVAGYLSRLGRGGDYAPGKRVREAVDNPEKWTSKKAPTSVKVAVDTVLGSGLNELTRQAVNYYDEQFMVYNSAGKTLSYIYMLGIMTDISRKITEYTSEENILLLSDSSRLLKEIIGSNDAPFIYEKIGNIYQHFMIDEFQDTSRMQWDNFRPLVENSLATGQHSMVVGDVKQSIYRWRNGDWKLLADQLEVDFQALGVNSRHLDYNWRSYRNVIGFNNAFYSLASHVVQEHYNGDMPDILHDSLKDERKKITSAYEDVCQRFPSNSKKTGGYVEARFITSGDDKGWMDQVLEDLPHKIEQLQDKGYRAGDIAILVRKASEGRAVADRMMRHKNGTESKSGYNYDVISNDSLYLKNSPIIGFLVHLLQYFSTPDDPINRAFIIQEYYSYIREEDFSDPDKLYELMGDYDDDFKSMLPREFVDGVESLKRLPLYDMVEELLSLFELNNNPQEYTYLQSFQDLVLGFSQGEAPDLASFLEWWDEYKDKQVISPGDNQDAIRIMTIHKSKGLEFKAVILPFCGWELDNNPLHSNILWCRPGVEGFNRLDVLPIRYGSALKETIYYREYYQEQLQAFVDNLNLLYVATTRAEKVLLIYSPAPSPKAKGLKSVSDVMYFVFNNAQNFALTSSVPLIPLGDGWSDENKCFKLGDLSQESSDIKAEQKLTLSHYPVHLLDDRLKLKYHAGEYFDFSVKESVDEIAPISRGNILHELFQLIRYKDDLEPALRKLQFEGKLDGNQVVEARNIASKLLNEDQVGAWFTRDWTVINERDILLGQGDTMRPDRVMVKGDVAVVVDYKFGKKKQKSYLKQVKKYMELLKQMGYSSVEGYLLYGQLEEVVKVHM